MYEECICVFGWKNDIIVPLYTQKDSKRESLNYKGFICYVSLGKYLRGILTEGHKKVLMSKI